MTEKNKVMEEHTGKAENSKSCSQTQLSQAIDFPRRQNKGDSDFLRMNAGSRFSQTDIQGNDCMTACQVSVAAAASHHLSEN